MGSQCEHPGSQLDDSPEGKRCPSCKMVIYLPWDPPVSTDTEKRPERKEGEAWFTT